MATRIGKLPHTLEDGDQPVRDLASRRPTIFLDYSGTLMAIVDPAEDALISETTRWLKTPAELRRRAARGSTIYGPTLSGTRARPSSVCWRRSVSTVATPCLYLADDITDEHAFEVLAGRGFAEGRRHLRRPDQRPGGGPTYHRRRPRPARHERSGTDLGHASTLTTVNNV